MADTPNWQQIQQGGYRSLGGYLAQNPDQQGAWQQWSQQNGWHEGGGPSGLAALPGAVGNVITGKPYAQAGQSFKNAGDQADAQGMKAWGQQMTGLDNALGQFGDARDQYKSLYGQGGQLTQPGYMENYVNGLQNGTNPYWNRIEQQGVNNINQDAAARGSFNSGGALASLGNFRSGIAGQQGQQLAGLMGQADQSRMQRLGGGLNAAMGLGQAGSGLYQGFYGQGGQFENSDTMAGINARLQAAYLPLLQQQQNMNLLGTGLGLLGRL